MPEEEIIIGVYYDREERTNKSLEKVIYYVNEYWFTNATAYLAGSGPPFWLGEDIVVISSEKVTVNEMDCMKFIGTTLNKKQTPI